MQVTVNVTDHGSPVYTVAYHKAEVIQTSRLGLRLADADYTQGLALTNAGKAQRVTDAYTLANDKRANCRYETNRQELTFAGSKGRKINIIFPISNDGVAFRYLLPGKSDEVQRVLSESTIFHLPAAARAWLHPHAVAQTGWANTQPSYKENYQMGRAGRFQPSFKQAENGYC